MTNIMRSRNSVKLYLKKWFPLTILWIIFLIISFGFSCDGTLKEKYLFKDISINDTIIKENNNLQLQLDINFPSKYKNKLSYIAFQPLIITKQFDTIYLRTYKIQGEKVKDNYEIVSYEKGKTIRYIDKFIIETKNTLDRLILKVDFMNSGIVNSDITEYYLIKEYLTD